MSEAIADVEHIARIAHIPDGTIQNDRGSLIISRETRLRYLVRLKRARVTNDGLATVTVHYTVSGNTTVKDHDVALLCFTILLATRSDSLGLFANSKATLLRTVLRGVHEIEIISLGVHNTSQSLRGVVPH